MQKTNLPESCKTSGHCFRKRKHTVDYKKTVTVKCSRCGQPEPKRARR